MKILIADPDLEFVTIVTYWLRSRGHHPLIARNARETLKRWHEEAPDLILIDLDLPGTGGADFCRRLRQTAPGIILVLADPAREAEEVRALEQGADEYLAKPISTRQLQAHMTALVRRAHATADTAVPQSIKVSSTGYLLRLREQAPEDALAATEEISARQSISPPGPQQRKVFRRA